MTSLRRRTASLLASSLTASLAGVLAASVLTAPWATAKPDTLFPSMGNSGYQVRAYDVALRNRVDGVVGPLAVHVWTNRP